MNILKNIVVLSFLATAVPVSAQESIGASESIEAFRPINEQRIWTFSHKNETMGHLVSWVKGKTTIDGQEAVIIQEKLDVDYAKTGAARVIFNEGEHYVGQDGRYLGDKMLLRIDEAEEKFEFERKGDNLSGFFTRGGREVERSVPIGDVPFAWDDNFIDQLELLLAMQPLQVGKEIEVDYYMPRSFLQGHLKGLVVSFEYQELWKNRFDSVFIIHVIEPQDYQLFFTKDKRLIRTDILSQNIRVYLDAVLPAPGQSAARQNVKNQKTRIAPAQLPWYGRLVAAMPHIIVHLIVAAIGLAMLALRGFKQKSSYVGFAGGLVLFGLLLVTQVPVTKHLILPLLASQVQAGGSLALWGLLPALVTALFYEAYRFAGLVVLSKMFTEHRERLPILGAFVGAGIAVFESGWVASQAVTRLMDWPLLESSFFILFHIGAGWLVGQSLVSRRALPVLMILFVIHLVLRALPMLVQVSSIAPELLYLLMGLLVLVYLFVLLLLQRRQTA